ncbi:MAG: hypothetical protein NC225_10210 [Clostridium sp.]|nr:hypothetical protein [Clostridium sp.]MCM1399837.1 hypothetical protein [Clostridium sp.]MCM1460678.1 hypothetical protein [Bacteroides sp.]
MNYNELLYTLLMPVTGDSSRPVLIAICLIVSIVLMVVLIITGKSSKKEDDEDDE